MKILVPIDFSECSNSAVAVAAQIAKQRAASICLYHGVHYFVEELHRDLSESQIEAWKSVLEERILLKRDTLRAQGLEVEHTMSFGNFIDELTKHCEKKHYDLLIMGSHGASGLEKLMMGSKTQKVIRKIHQNILVVKNDTPLDLDKVLFVSNLSLDDRDAFQYFLEFVSHWQPSEVHLLAVDTGGFFSQPAYLMMTLLEEFAKIPTDSKVITHFESGATVDHGVKKFTEGINIGLIGISNRNRHPVRRVLRGSNVEVLVTNSQVPVLTLDF